MKTVVDWEGRQDSPQIGGAPQLPGEEHWADIYVEDLGL